MIDYIVNSDKAYPAWIKEHNIFKQLKKINKVFPSIGLQNTEVNVDISNENDILTIGKALLAEMGGKIPYTLQSDEGSEFRYAFYDAKIALNNKVASLNITKNFTYKKEKILSNNESAHKAYNKVVNLLEAQGTKIPKLEDLYYFKSFSQVNIPNVQHKLIFSSTGELGAWDLATISMRGVESCQSWTAPQSRALVGAITNKYTGVIYVTSNTPTAYGTKMLRRALVRYVINRNTKKPYLFLDVMYPSTDPKIERLFIDFLTQQSKLEVLKSSTGTDHNIFIPYDNNSKYLGIYEQLYLDRPMPIGENRVKASTQLVAFLNTLLSIPRKYYDYYHAYDKEYYQEYNILSATLREKIVITDYSTEINLIISYLQCLNTMKFNNKNINILISNTKKEIIDIGKKCIKK